LDNFEAASGIEIAIIEYELNSHGDSQKQARKTVRRILQEFSGLEANADKNLAQTLEDISKQGKPESLRSISIFLLRLLTVQGFFPASLSSGSTDIWIVIIIEKVFKSIYKEFDIEVKEQTFEKISKLKEVVNHCHEKLSCLVVLSPKIETISETRKAIHSSLADKTLNSFLMPYDFPRIRASIDSILGQVIKLSSTADFTFERKLKDLSDYIQDEISYCKQRQVFLTDKYYRPFLDQVEEATNAIARKSKERFICAISSSQGENISLEKRYPLHLSESKLRVFVPFTNSGPGIAESVSVDFIMDAESALLDSEKINLGSVIPGNFMLPISIEVFGKTQELSVIGTISWKIIGSAESRSYTFIVKIESQAKDVNWTYLSSLNPYSLEIATGENFHGRNDFVKRLIARTKNGRMDSSFITGQRRVGKSSLAKAVEDRLAIENPNCFVMNIECGDFKAPTTYATVDTLRESLSLFLVGHLPQGIQFTSGTSTTGSLSSLSSILSNLEKTEPSKSFLIIIDEFDELNPDLYRYSDIAETFFLNLRSMSGKRNLGFIFIGAEKMAYVMSSQGEKLNRFTKESLDKFSHVNEWADFEKLVRGNIDKHVTWHDSAILSIFKQTNGHPFFSKQVCAKVFENVISSKDAEVSHEEVEVAVKQLIAELDTNSFQHFWRDGIVEPEEVEITSYKRCQTLAALARTIRLGQETLTDNIQKNISSSKFKADELLPYLSDFCRRNILSELDGKYSISILLFERWLVNEGFSKLIADQLSDDLYMQRQNIEDESFVTDEEIDNLVKKWPDYRGIQISPHATRAWISQVPSHIQQRFLYKILERIRFFSQAEIRGGSKSLHERLKSKLNVVITKSKAQRRKDIWVTYIDGAGKSGSQYASMYAEENLISTTCVKEMNELDAYCKGSKKIPPEVSSIIIVDDFIGTGNSLSSNLTSFFEKNGDFLSRSKIEIYVAVLCATIKGEEKVRRTLSKLSQTSDLIVYEYLDPKHYAFNDLDSHWADDAERNAAKDLIQRLGTHVDKARPLGYENSAMLIVFNRNCPNNTLPILHSSGRGSSPWIPLFERVKH
jgi:hypothetical protein